MLQLTRDDDVTAPKYAPTFVGICPRSVTRGKTVSFEEQIMSKDRYLYILAPNKLKRGYYRCLLSFNARFAFRPSSRRGGGGGGGRGGAVRAPYCRSRTFFPSIYGPSVKRAGHKCHKSTGKKQ